MGTKECLSTLSPHDLQEIWSTIVESKLVDLVKDKFSSDQAKRMVVLYLTSVTL